MSALHKLVKAVKQPEYYVPRDYKTIGGMWTVDTWQRGAVQVRLMDEGWTTAVDGPGLSAVDSGSTGVMYEIGDEAVASQLLTDLK